MNEQLNPGKYFLGDPSFVLSDKIYNGLWGNLYNYSNGKFILDNYEFIAHNTHYGNGSFTDSKNRIYEVESGFISLVNIDLIDKENLILCKKGSIFTFNEKINFIYDAGFFHIKSGNKIITIDTRNLDEYDSEIEEHYENEDGEYITKTINGDSDTDSIIEENNFTESNDIDHEEKDNNNNPNKIEKFSFFKKK
jgi:hypothetical protein